MAYGSVSTSTGVQCNLRLVYWGTPNQSTNSSSVYVELYLDCRTLNMGARTDNYVIINGSKKTFSISAKDLGSGPNNILLTSYTVNVPHNADGTKTVAISGSWDARITYSGTYLGRVDVSVNAKLDNIAVAPNVPGAPASVSASGDYEGDNAKIPVTWSKSSGVVDGYRVEYQIQYSSGSYSAWTLVWSSTPYTSGTVTVPAGGTQVQFRVAAVNSSGLSTFTESNILLHYGIRVHNGSTFAYGQAKVWGGRWMHATIRVYDGKQWVLTK